MEKMKKRITKWLLGLLSTVVVLAGLVGCGSSDVNQVLDAAIEVLEVVESLEAEAETGGEAESEGESLISSIASESTGASETIALESADTKSDREDQKKADQEIESTSDSGGAQISDAGNELQKAEEETEVEDHQDQLTVDEDGHYTSKEEVALYIHTYGKLPENFISKKDAEELGWKKKQGEAGQLHVAAPGMSIGGSYFGNYEGLLPEKKGRKYYECDINYVKGNRGAERIVYSNDGLIFYTGDHYETFEQLYPEE